VGIEHAVTSEEEGKVIDKIFTEWEELERKT